MKPKLFVRLVGGLGNQMFQYAAALAVAEGEKAELEVDTEDFKDYPSRTYMLDRLHVDAKVAAKRAVRPFRLALRFGRLGSALLWPARFRLLVEQGFSWQCLRLVGAHRAWMSGYWQSWRYGQPVQEQLRKAFMPRSPASGINQVLLRELQGNLAVCVHVRRGDYSSDSRTRATHGVLDPAYYQMAIRRLGLSGATPYVFSDEPSWARDNMKLGPKTRYVDHNPPDRPEEDLRLMLTCKHFVIANSSLSWWAAWLGDHPGKRVIAPIRWFASAGRDTRDLLPREWLRM